MAKANRTPDNEMRSAIVISTIFAIPIAWVIGYAYYYNVPRTMFFKGMWYAFIAAPTTPVLWIAPILVLVLGVALLIYGSIHWTNNFGGQKYTQLLRGPKLVNQHALRKRLKRGKDQLIFCTLPVPKDVETTHFFVGGATGTGKSQCIAEYVERAQARGDRILCIDPDGGFMRHFFKDGDVILNPFDARGQGWSIFNEIRTPFDCEQYAISMIPKSPSTEAEQWNSMARTIVSETMSILVKDDEMTTERLVHWLTSASNADLKKKLSGTPAEGCFHGAEETLASIRTVLTQYVTPHKYLAPGAFSVRDYLETGSGNIWVTWREDQLQALKPLISCWADVICASVLSMPEDRNRCLHYVCDELDSLEKLNYIVDVATKGRKKGFRLLVGIQSLAQLDKTYGEKEALTLRNSFRSAAYFGMADLDTYTAEQFSKALGEHTVIRPSHSSSEGGKGGSRGTRGWKQDTEPVVSPSEIHLLPNLIAYVKFAGNYPISRVNLKFMARPKVVEPMILSEAFTVRVRPTSYFAA